MAFWRLIVYGNEGHFQFLSLTDSKNDQSYEYLYATRLLLTMNTVFMYAHGYGI